MFASRPLVGDDDGVYREATPTLHRLSLARRRRVRFEIAVCSLLALLATTVSLEVARTSPTPARVLAAGAAVAAVCVWLLWRSLRTLSTRLTLHPGGALAVASWHGQTTVHAEQVRDVQSPDDGARDDVELLDAEGRRLVVIPAVFDDAAEIAAWLDEHVGVRMDADARYAARRDRLCDALADEGRSERDAERFWTRLGWLSAAGLGACAAGFVSWIAGPSYNRWGALGLAACLAAAAALATRNRTVIALDPDRHEGTLGLAALPVLGLVMNAALNLRETFDGERLALAALSIAGVLLVALAPLLRAIGPTRRRARNVIVALALVTSPALAQLADTLFDPYAPIAVVEGVVVGTGAGTNRVVHVEFALAGARRETLFAPPFRAGFRADPGAPVRVVVGRGLLGVAYVREVGPR